eukprot:1157247-Pelagomonas_calceolata.AAC.9
MDYRKSKPSGFADCWLKPLAKVAGIGQRLSALRAPSRTPSRGSTGTMLFEAKNQWWMEQCPHLILHRFINLKKRGPCTTLGRSSFEGRQRGNGSSLGCFQNIGFTLQTHHQAAANTAKVPNGA